MDILKNQTRITSIVAIDRNGAIGCRNALPWSLKTDMAVFRRTTLGNTIIMGRKTFDSIGSCLPGRNNIILSHNDILFPQTPQSRIATSIGEALFLGEKFRDQQIFVIGGSQTYRQFAPFVDRYLITFVDHVVQGADAFLDESILNDAKAWPRTLITNCGGGTESDQYPFEIYEIIPSDFQARRELQAAERSSFASNVAKRPVPKKMVYRQSTGLQEAFAF